MIEIRTYDGEPAELAAFCTGVWRDRYRDKMAVPLWSGPFIREPRMGLGISRE